MEDAWLERYGVAFAHWMDTHLGSRGIEPKHLMMIGCGGALLFLGVLVAGLFLAK